LVAHKVRKKRKKEKERKGIGYIKKKRGIGVADRNR
jgi:hypothetical protein